MKIDTERRKRRFKKTCQKAGGSAVLVMMLYTAGCSSLSQPRSISTPVVVRIEGADICKEVVYSLAAGYRCVRGEAVDFRMAMRGDGAAAWGVISGEFDLGVMSRFPTPREFALSMQRSRKLVAQYVGVEALCVIVNKENPIATLTQTQIAGMYSGEVRNWREVGGANQNVTPLCTPVDSDYFFFCSRILRRPPGAGTRRVTARRMQSEVVADKGAIAYIRAGFLTNDNVKAISIGRSNFSWESVAWGNYTLQRPLLFVTAEPDDGESALHDFISFCLGEEGQRIVAESGFLPITSAASVVSPLTNQPPSTTNIPVDIRVR